MEYNRKKQEEVHLQELKAQLSESIIADPPLPVDESIRIVHDSKKEWQLPDAEIVKVPPAVSLLPRTARCCRFFCATLSPSCTLTLTHSGCPRLQRSSQEPARYIGRSTSWPSCVHRSRCHRWCASD